MKTCPYCATVNREGVLFCEECGNPFLEAGNNKTSTLATNKLLPADEENLRGRMTWGTARFDRTSTVVIHVRDHPEPLQLVPQEELIVGRSDPQTSVLPDLDLAAYGAADLGVSRRHAAIRRGEDTLTLIDLGSTNGTHLNGQRLIPYQPRVLRDGDEIRMGRLVFHIFFK